MFNNNKKILRLKSISSLDEDTLKELPQNYLPEITVTSSGHFIKPVIKVNDGGSISYIKFIILKPNKVPIHGHDYPYVKIPENGYLMRVTVPVIGDSLSMDFRVDYVVDINNMIMSDAVSTLYQSNEDSEISSYNLRLFESSLLDDDEIKQLVLNMEEFFERYLKNIE